MDAASTARLPPASGAGPLRSVQTPDTSMGHRCGSRVGPSGLIRAVEFIRLEPSPDAGARRAVLAVARARAPLATSRWCSRYQPRSRSPLHAAYAARRTPRRRCQRRRTQHVPCVFRHEIAKRTSASVVIRPRLRWCSRRCSRDRTSAGRRESDRDRQLPTARCTSRSRCRPRSRSQRRN